MIDPLQIFAVFDYFYIVAVVLVVERLKPFVPEATSFQKVLLTVGVAIVLGAGFVGFDLLLPDSPPVSLRTRVSQLLVSFLGVATLYSIIAKPILEKIKQL